MNKAYKTLFFDLDGTLLDTSKDLQKALHVVQSEYQCPLSDLETTQSFMGHGIQSLVYESLKERTEKDKEEAFLLFQKSYHHFYKQDSKPYLGIVELLKQLKDKGYQLAVISNKLDIYTQELITINFGSTFFDYVCGAKEDVLKKPAKDMLVNALNTLHEEVSNCLYIGDTEVDVEFAKNMNMDVMVVGWGYRDFEGLKALDPDYACETVADCLKTLACV